MRHLPHQARAEELRDEALVAVIGPDVAQHAMRVAVAGDVGEPLAVLVGRARVQMRSMSCIMREAERVGVDAAVARVVEFGLER